METEKMHIALDTDPQIARLILDTAEFLSKSPPKDWDITTFDTDAGNRKSYTFVRVSPALVKEAADLVFLSLSLIAEKRG